MGSDEYERLVVDAIRMHMEELGFTPDQVILSGVSMGAFGAMYYGCDIRPHAMIVGKPLVSIGNVAANEKHLRPGGFPTSLDVLKLQGGGLDKEHFKKSLKGIATNPIILGIFFGLIISVARIKLPVIASKTLHNLAQLATPLALIGLGAGFEGRKALAKIKPTIASSLIKLFVMPAVFLPAAASLGFRNEKMVAILIMLGAPTTASCYIMCKNMGHEGILSSSCVVSTTFFSAVFITIWLYLLKSYGLI